MTNSFKPAHVVEITADNDQQRIDNFLLRYLKNIPKTHVYKLLRKGEVRINGGRAKPIKRLKTGDRVRIPPMRISEQAPFIPPDPALCEQIENQIIYQDDDVLVINKPSGLAVQRGSGTLTSLIDVLKVLYPDATGLNLAHRIDKQTSGCVLVAKNRKSLLALQKQFRDGNVQKHYEVMVKGHWPHPENYKAEFSLLYTKDDNNLHKVIVDPQGKPSVTYFSLIKQAKKVAHLAVKLETGRMHQIRVHTQALKHPIGGDAKYGDFAFNRYLQQLGCKRLLLHAIEFTFTHPTTQKLVSVNAKEDKEWQACLDIMNC